MTPREQKGMLNAIATNIQEIEQELKELESKRTEPGSSYYACGEDEIKEIKADMTKLKNDLASAKDSLTEQLKNPSTQDKYFNEKLQDLKSLSNTSLLMIRFPEQTNFKEVAKVSTSWGKTFLERAQTVFEKIKSVFMGDKAKNEVHRAKDSADNLRRGLIQKDPNTRSVDLNSAELFNRESENKIELSEKRPSI